MPTNQASFVFSSRSHLWHSPTPRLSSLQFVITSFKRTASLSVCSPFNQHIDDAILRSCQRRSCLFFFLSLVLAKKKNLPAFSFIATGNDQFIIAPYGGLRFRLPQNDTFYPVVISYYVIRYHALARFDCSKEHVSCLSR